MGIPYFSDFFIKIDFLSLQGWPKTSIFVPLSRGKGLLRKPN